MNKGSAERNILVICGPNASGKTRLAVALAQKTGGEIISADSRQVYRGMDIGTGKDLSEYANAHSPVKYHLIDIADPSQIYTLYHYQRDCYAAIRDIWSRGIIPVLVGGTGLYIEAVLKGYEIDEVPEDRKFRQTLGNRPKEELAGMLKEIDAILYERTDCSSKKRIIRALERAYYTDSLAQERQRFAPPQLKALILGVRWPRRELIGRIDKRLETRLKEGMVDEVKRLLASGIPRERFDLFGMEYRHVARFIDGLVDYDTMVQQLRTDIHRLAKRQMTWFRGMQRRGIPIEWIERADIETAMAVLGKNVFT